MKSRRASRPLRITHTKKRLLKTLLFELREVISLKDPTRHNSSVVDCCTFLIDALEDEDG